MVASFLLYFQQFFIFLSHIIVNNIVFSLQKMTDRAIFSLCLFNYLILP